MPSELYNDPLLDLEHLVKTLQTVEFIARNRQFCLDVGMSIEAPQAPDYSLRRFLESYSAATPQAKVFVGRAHKQRGKVDSLGFSFFNARRPILNFKGIFRDQQSGPVRFGYRPLLVCTSTTMKEISGLIGNFANTAKSLGLNVTYAARSNELRLAEGVSQETKRICLGTLEKSPQQIGEVINQLTEFVAQATDFALIIEDCDYLAKHQGFEQLIEVIHSREIPALLLSNAQRGNENAKLFETLNLRQTASIFSMEPGSDCAKWFQRETLKESFLKKALFKEDYKDGDFLIHLQEAENASPHGWYEHPGEQQE